MYFCMLYLSEQGIIIICIEVAQEPFQGTTTPPY